MAPEAGRPAAWVIVLNWNGLAHLPDCLGSLSALTYPDAHVLLVDNGSTDGSVAWVRENFPDVELLETGRNLGFTGGNNAGMRHALERGADYVILLNNDTRVEPDVVDRLVEAGERDPAAGVIGGTIRMFYQPDVLNSTGVDLNLWGYGRDRDFAAPASTERPAGEVLAVSGCLMAVKRCVLEEVGLLDDRFFAYFEDVDLCLRVWDETDFHVVYAPRAVIYHKFSASTAGAAKVKALLYMKNHYRVFLRHFPTAHLWRSALPFLSHRLSLLWSGKKNLSPGASWSELGVMIWFSARIAALPLTRILARIGRRAPRRERFWPLLIQERGLPDAAPFCPDHARRASTPAEALALGPLSDRMVVGVNDSALGGDWGRMVPDIPRHRPLGGRGVCFLDRAPGATYLQIHAFAHPRVGEGHLWASVRGTGWASVSLRHGWTTYHFQLAGDPPPGPVAVELEGRDNRGVPLGEGLSVNEVALLGPGSPHLRVGRPV